MTAFPAFDELVALLRGRRVVALTGAGCSTESGIPDYRGPETRRRARNPIQYNAFAGDPSVRARYWARSTVGWPRVAAARPNAGHHALARLEAAGLVGGVITQNVDGLHRAAGSTRVVELHGTLSDVCCLGCGARSSRWALHRQLLALNPAQRAAHGAELAPDGDAELSRQAEAGFRVPPCATCGGALKPDVVFFGESVPKARVEAAYALLDEAEVLLVVGSSLAVYSGYRFVLHAAKEGVPIAFVNLGATRGDRFATVCVDGRSGEVLPALADALLGPTAAAIYGV